LVRQVLLPVLLIIGLAAGAVADDTAQPPRLTLEGKHQVGIRLGGWVNQGETHPEFLYDTNSTASLETSIKSGSFYLEGYYAYRLMPGTWLEFSAGIVNRGSVTINDLDDGFTDIGNLTVYPFLLQLKFYPLAPFNARLQPYVTAGGGLYYGRRSVQITNNAFSYYGFNDDTETDFNYALGGGLDWLISNKIAIDLNVKYMPINFSNTLVTVRDYDAVTITVGVKYLYAGKK